MWIMSNMPAKLFLIELRSVRGLPAPVLCRMEETVEIFIRILYTVAKLAPTFFDIST